MSDGQRAVFVRERFPWWMRLHPPRGYHVCVECRICGTDQWGPTRRRATQALLKRHTPGDWECREIADELHRALRRSPC